MAENCLRTSLIRRIVRTTRLCLLGCAFRVITTCSMTSGIESSGIEPSKIRYHFRKLQKLKLLIKKNLRITLIWGNVKWNRGQFIYRHSSYNAVLLYRGILSYAVFSNQKTTLKFYLTRFFLKKVKKMKKNKFFGWN